MKVKDLLDFLSTCDPDAVVFIDDLASHADEFYSIDRALACRSPDNLDSWVLIQIDTDAD